MLGNEGDDKAEKKHKRCCTQHESHSEKSSTDSKNISTFTASSKEIFRLHIEDRIESGEDIPLIESISLTSLEVAV